MDKLKVFISSTMTELNDERAIVKQSLDERHMEAVWFEGFGAQPNSPQRAYLDAVEECDIYLGLFWNRYSAATEEEYRKANELQKPCFIYVKNFNVRRDDGLVNLLNEIGKKLVYKIFTNVVELKDYVQKDIINWLVAEYRKTRMEFVGWAQFIDESHFTPRLGDIVEPYPMDATLLQSLKERLDLLLDGLSERERHVIERRYGLRDGKVRTIKQISREFGITPGQVKVIEDSALRKLRQPLRMRKLREWIEDE